MRCIFNKKEYINIDIKCINYYLFNKVLLLRKENSYTYRKTYLLGLCISSKKTMDYVPKNTIDLNNLFTASLEDYKKNVKNPDKSFKFWQNLLEYEKNAKQIIYWFDHTSKGGTEVYSANKINEITANPIEKFFVAMAFAKCSQIFMCNHWHCLYIYFSTAGDCKSSILF